MKPKFSLLGIALVLAGCATPFRAPRDVAHLQLDRTHSPVVRVEKIWLERNEGGLQVRGYVDRRVEGADTAGTHLDVILYDASGQILRHTVESFSPAQIRHRRPHPDFAAYAATLDPLPHGTTRIEVHAHEAPPHP